MKKIDLAINILDAVDAKSLAIEIKQIASQSQNEEELKIKVEYLLRIRILDMWKIPWASYEHRTLVSGIRKDALYGTVIIEYKKPGSLSNETQFEKFKSKVKQYITEEAKDAKFYDRYFGVLFDGNKIAFIRYRKNEWDEPTEAKEVNPYTVLRLLEAIRGLTRKPIDVEFLLQDFGPKSYISKNSIISLYHALIKSKVPRTQMLFDDWRNVFSQICAYSKEKLSGLISYYEIEDANPDVEKILFSIHTYYTLFMKLLTSEIVTLFADSIIGSYLKRIEEAYYIGPQEMQSELKELEEGGLFVTLGIKNFLEADYFAWYLDDWNKEIADSISQIVKKLMDYEPATVELNPERVQDLFKRLYQNLLPRDVRRKLGEYFTPDWLAELLLNEINYDGHPEKSILDPACGSGTFLVLAIKKVKDYADDHFLSKSIILKKIIDKIKGIDLNPLAVLASKANYIIALSSLLRYKSKEGIEIPVYLADSIFVGRRPVGQKGYKAQLELVESKQQGEWEVYVTTNEGDFWVPHEVIDKLQLSNVLDLINECVKDNKYSEEEFEKRLKNNVQLSEYAYGAVKRLYSKILKLEKRNKNKIWTRLLKNRFAPLFIGKFDFVVGNPPWINWENLPEYHRNETKPLWDYYGLRETTKGKGLGKVKRDLSMLFVARCFDRYLKNKGILSFLVPFTLIKTQTGAGFRRFLSKGFTHRWGKDKEVPVETLKVHDLVELKPFQDAVNRTAMVIIKRGETKFPIACTMWSNPTKKNIPIQEELKNVYSNTKQNDMILTPVAINEVSSPWMIITKLAYNAIKKTLGKSPWYLAHMGIKTALNAIYWINIISRNGDYLIVSNASISGQKKKITPKTDIIEPDLVYPLYRGRELKRWCIFKNKYFIIVPHDKTNGKPLAEEELKIKYPKTYDFLYNFKSKLENRSIHKLWGKNNPFYSLYDISEYTFENNKVAWKPIAGAITGKAVSFASVVLLSKYDDLLMSTKPMMPDNSVITISVPDKSEAYYISAILNSAPIRTAIATYTYEIRMETHIMNHIFVPKFNMNEPLHREISDLSKFAHNLASKNSKEKLIKIQNQIDQNVAQLYNINTEELIDIKKCLLLLKTGKLDATTQETD